MGRAAAGRIFLEARGESWHRVGIVLWPVQSRPVEVDTARLLRRGAMLHRVRSCDILDRLPRCEIGGYSFLVRHRRYYARFARSSQMETFGKVRSVAAVVSIG